MAGRAWPVTPLILRLCALLRLASLSCPLLRAARAKPEPPLTSPNPSPAGQLQMPMAMSKNNPPALKLRRDKSARRGGGDRRAAAPWNYPRMAKRWDATIAIPGGRGKIQNGRSCHFDAGTLRHNSRECPEMRPLAPLVLNILSFPVLAGICRDCGRGPN